MRFTIYKTRNKKWAWHLKAKNGEIIAQGESYTRRRDCFDAIRLVVGTDSATPVDFPNKA